MVALNAEEIDDDSEDPALFRDSGAVDFCRDWSLGFGEFALSRRNSSRPRSPNSVWFDWRWPLSPAAFSSDGKSKVVVHGAP
jgi:hypothetical protein